MNEIKVHPLRAWRTSQGLSQTELAEKLGYHTPGLIHSIETYKLDPRASEIAKLCQLSGYALTLWDFVKEKGPDHANPND